MLNLKLRAETKGGFVWKLALGRHLDGGGGLEPSPRCDGSGQWTEGQERICFFVNYPPCILYRCLSGVACRGIGCGTEWGAGINLGNIQDWGGWGIRERKGEIETYNGVPSPTEQQRSAPNNSSVSISR